MVVAEYVAARAPVEVQAGWVKDGMQPVATLIGDRGLADGPFGVHLGGGPHDGETLGCLLTGEQFSPMLIQVPS